MAIYHWHLQTISRADGRSAIAAAAYRAGVRLMDERTGLVHDYRRRSGVVHGEIVLPKGAEANLADRAHLWNAAEAAEARCNSVVAREVVAAIPHELPHAAQVALLRGHARHVAETLDVAVDVVLHRGGARRRRHQQPDVLNGLPGGDPRNIHGHLMLTTRRVAGLQTGKKTRELDDRKSGSAIIEALRTDWEQRVNAALLVAGIDARIDRRSLAARGDARAPMPKLGPGAAALERRSIVTERGMSWRVVRDSNIELVDLDRVMASHVARRDAANRKHAEERRTDKEIARLRARQRELESERRLVAPPLDMAGALDRVGNRCHARLQEAIVSAQGHQRRAIERSAQQQWWRILARWRTRKEADRSAACLSTAIRGLAAFVEKYREAAERMVLDDLGRRARKICRQAEVQAALNATELALQTVGNQRLSLGPPRAVPERAIAGVEKRVNTKARAR